jgi:serine protease inhibitor
MADGHDVSASERLVATNMNQFGVRLLQRVLAHSVDSDDSSPGQVLLSPFSISVCLALGLLGAQGQTLRGLFAALSQREDAVEPLGALSRRLNGDSVSASTTTTADTQERTPLKQQQQMRKRFGLFRGSKAASKSRELSSSSSSPSEMGIVLRVANAVFYRKDLEVLNTFQTAVRESFNSEVRVAMVLGALLGCSTSGG